MSESTGMTHSGESKRLCSCGRLPATVAWGDMLAFTHGGLMMICEACALERQIEHAEERAAALPGMRDKLAEVLNGR